MFLHGLNPAVPLLTACVQGTNSFCPCMLLLQVRYSETSPSVLAHAARLGGGRAQPALQLVGYEPEIEAAIKYAFGNAFICQVRRH